MYVLYKLMMTLPGTLVWDGQGSQVDDKVVQRPCDQDRCRRTRTPGAFGTLRLRRRHQAGRESHHRRVDAKPERSLVDEAWARRHRLLDVAQKHRLVLSWNFGRPQAG